MRRVLPLAWVAVVVAGSSCVDLTRPRLDGSAGRDGSADQSDGAGANDGESEPIADASPEAPVDGGLDSGADVEMCPTLSNGLVGYWKLDESSSSSVAADSSGMGNDGQIMGTPGRTSTNLPPVINDHGAFMFDGQNNMDDGIQVADSASLRPAAISIALWVKLSSLDAASVCGDASGQMQYMVERRNPRGAAGKFEAVALLKQAQGTFAFLLTAADGTQDYATSSSLNLPVVDTWYHLVGTYDGSSLMQLYVNGALEGAHPHTAAIAYDPTWPLFMGRTGECGVSNGAAWDARLNGMLDDVRVYNRALSACEVARLAAGAD